MIVCGSRARHLIFVQYSVKPLTIAVCLNGNATANFYVGCRFTQVSGFAQDRLIKIMMPLIQ